MNSLGLLPVLTLLLHNFLLLVSAGTYAEQGQFICDLETEYALWSEDYGLCGTTDCGPCCNTAWVDDYGVVDCTDGYLSSLYALFCIITVANIFIYICFRLCCFLLFYFFCVFFFKNNQGIWSIMA